MNRKDKILSTLNPMQKEAVLKTEGPLLVLAGAGSGKTRVLTHRIAYLMEELGVRAFNILAITFTNKAAREMKERVTAITEDGRLVWVSTFHSTCVRILRREIERLGYTQNFTIYDSEDSQRIIKEVLNELHLDVRKFPPKAVLSAIGSLKDELITPYAAMDMAADYTERKNAEIYNCYQNKLKSYNALDFDDLIFKTVELFSKQPEVLEKYQDRFIYIMVDEYQDTNTAQYTLIRLLSSKYGNLCVVGDDDQSIYGWRGANIRNILEFEKDFENTVVIKLEQNYRSTKVILDAANSVIKNNYGRKAKKLWTENDSGEKVSFHRLNSDIEEAGFICEEIMKMAGSKKAEYKDFAILYRNNALSRVLEERFVRASVPYRLYGSVNFYGRKEIKDVMAYLKAVFNPDDENAIKRIINVPKRGIGESTADKVSVYAAANEISFFDVLSNINKIPEFKTRAKRLNAFYELLCEFSQLADNLRPSELIEAVLKKTEYIGELRAEGTEEALGRIENVMELVSKAVEYEQDNPEDCSLAGFLNEISLVADTDNTKEDENRVVLMTLHSSKGLEFNYVFLAGFEDGIFPSRRVDFSSDINAVEEERRLCYVGITRAKKQLYITCAKSRLQYGNIDYNMPSRFLKEIPREFIDGLENETKIDIDSEEEDTDIAYKPKLEYIVVRPQRGIERREFPAPKDIKLDFEVGDTVRQMKYGKGVVKKISPAGADYEVTVDFEMAGEKKIMAVLSKLRRV